MFDILLVFIILKWVGAVSWSWGTVFIPFWIWLAELIGGSLLAQWYGLDL